MPEVTNTSPKGDGNKGNLAALEAKVTALQTDVTALQTAVATLSDNVVLTNKELKDWMAREIELSHSGTTADDRRQLNP